MIFDAIASQYPYYSSFKNFLNLTMKQVHFMLASINERESKAMYAEFNFFATLQGVKLPSLAELSGLDSIDKLDEKTSTVLEDRALANLKQRQREYELGKHKRVTD